MSDKEEKENKAKRWLEDFDRAMEKQEKLKEKEMKERLKKMLQYRLDRDNFFTELKFKEIEKFYEMKAKQDNLRLILSELSPEERKEFLKEILKRKVW